MSAVEYMHSVMMRRRRREWFVHRKIKGEYPHLMAIIMCRFSVQKHASSNTDGVQYAVFALITCRYDELRSVVHAMKNSQKIKDISKVQTGMYMYIHTCICSTDDFCGLQVLRHYKRPSRKLNQWLRKKGQHLCSISGLWWS